jgi:hypothetical protein
VYPSMLDEALVSSTPVSFMQLMNLVITSFFCILFKTTLTRQSVLKHDREISELGANAQDQIASRDSTVIHKDIPCYHGMDSSPKACNESQDEMTKYTLVNTAQEEKKEKYKVCICWAVRFLTCKVFNVFSALRVTLFVVITKKNMKEKS